MASALKSAGKKHEVVIVRGADHYFLEDAESRQVLARLGDFLDEYLGE